MVEESDIRVRFFGVSASFHFISRIDSIEAEEQLKILKF
jgi:hypothetical protein